MRFRFHGISAALVQVLDEAEVQGTTTILITLELGDGGFGGFGSVESNDTRTTRPAARLVLDLSLLNLADCGEELHKIVVASRPRQLFQVSWRVRLVKILRLTFRT